MKQQLKAFKARNQTLTLDAKEYRSQINSLCSELREKEKAVAHMEEKLVLSDNRQTQTDEHEETIRSLRSQLSHTKGERQRLQQTLSHLQEMNQQPTRVTSTPQFSSSSEKSFVLQSQDTPSEHARLPPIRVSKSRQKEIKTSFRNSISAGNKPERK